MRFEWHEEKNYLNRTKHGIWFEEAQTVWVDPMASEFVDPDHSDDEDRFIRVGYSTLDRLLLVVFCERTLPDTIRIISARKATRAERQKHEEGV